MLNENEQKEEFSLAYIQAVAATAGFPLQVWRRDKDSIDLMIRGYGQRNGRPHRISIEVQLKCTAKEIPDEEFFKFDLKLKNYNELRSDEGVAPHILVVVFVPSDVHDWLEFFREKLIVKHCAYWISLRGFPEEQNTSQVRISIPHRNEFTVKALQEIVNRYIETGIL